MLNSQTTFNGTYMSTDEADFNAHKAALEEGIARMSGNRSLVYGPRNKVIDPNAKLRSPAHEAHIKKNDIQKNLMKNIVNLESCPAK